MTAGLNSEQILKFRYPEKESELADLKLLLDAGVLLETTVEEVKEGPTAGMKVARIAKVLRRPKA